MGMMRRKFPHEIKSYKSVMFYGLTARQAICVICALALAIPTAIFGNKFGLSSDTIGYLLIIEVIPFGAAGWIEYNNMALEKFAQQLIVFYGGSRRRKWQFTNTETTVHDAVMQLELERMTMERNKELADEKARIKSEKKAEKAKVKEEKKLKKIEKAGKVRKRYE